MKAAVLHGVGGIPGMRNFPDPIAGDSEVIVDVMEVAAENVDKMIAAAPIFARAQFLPQLPAILGFDGIGALPDGTLVGFSSPTAPYGAPSPSER